MPPDNTELHGLGDDNKIATAVEIRALPKKDLKTRLAETRALAQEAVKRIQSLQSPDEVKARLSAQVLSEEEMKALISEANALLKIDESTQFHDPATVNKMQEAIIQFEKFKKLIDAEFDKTLGQPIQELETEIERAKEALEKSKTASKISQFLNRKKIQALENTIKEQEDSLGQLKYQLRVKRRGLEKQEWAISNYRDTVKYEISRHVSQEIYNITEAYKSFAEEIENDGEMAKEMREAYILSQILIPEVSRLMKAEWMSEEKKAEILGALKQYIDNLHLPESEREPYRSKLYASLPPESIESVSNYRQKVFKREEDLGVRRDMVAYLAIDDLLPIETIVNRKNFDRYPSTIVWFVPQAEEVLGIGIKGWSQKADSFEKYIIDQLKNKTEGQGVLFDSHDIPVWKMLAQSNSAQHVFGKQEIEGRIDEDYKIRVRISGNDEGGSMLETLVNYPTPEVIRNLALIAAADPIMGRLNSANRALDELSKNLLWSSHVSAAALQYPELGALVQVLKDWQPPGNGETKYKRSGIFIAAKDLAKSVFLDKDTSPALKRMALDASSSSDLIDYLLKNSTLNEQDSRVLQQVAELSMNVQKAYKGSDIKQALTEQPKNTNNFPVVNIEFAIRKVMLALLKSQDGEGSANDKAKRNELARLVLLAKELVHQAEQVTQAQEMDEIQKINKQIQYLGDPKILELIGKLDLPNPASPSTNENGSDKEARLQVEISSILRAYESCPGLLTNIDLRTYFCKSYRGQESIVFCRDFQIGYAKFPNYIVPILRQLEEKNPKSPFSEADALAISRNERGVELLSSPYFLEALKLREYFLTSEEGYTLGAEIFKNGLFSLSAELDRSGGALINRLRNNFHKMDGFRHDGHFELGLGNVEISRLEQVVRQSETFQVTEKNWQAALLAFMRVQVVDAHTTDFSQESTEKIKAALKDSKNKDICLNGLKEQWNVYLRAGKPAEIPLSLTILSGLMDEFDGAGQLSQIEALLSLIGSVSKSFTRESIDDNIKQQVVEAFSRLEGRFSREKWSNEERTDFYNITRDVMLATPTLFLEFFALFESCTPAQLKQFARDIYPLYRTKLVLMEKTTKTDEKHFDEAELVKVIEDVRAFTEGMKAKTTTNEVKAKSLLEDVKNAFSERFGIIKVPEHFSPDHIRGIINVSTYLANFHERKPIHETTLGYYLALMVNDQWDSFRRGQEIPAAQYLTAQKAAEIQPLLEKRSEINPLTAAALGITPQELPEFMKSFQQETQHQVLGNLETIDVKLGNTAMNIRLLEDPDLFPDEGDKKRMVLLTKWGNKRVNGVLAKKFKALGSPSQHVDFDSNDQEAWQEIETLLQDEGREITQDVIKKHMQEALRPLVPAVNLLTWVEESNVEQEIESLRGMLKPSAEVIAIFNRLGEPFAPNSGAVALSQDLAFLDTLVVKREDELTSDEKQILKEYIQKIRDQVVKMEGLQQQLVKLSGQLKINSTDPRYEQLIAKLTQIDRIINAKVEQYPIVSTLSGNLNLMIENIRECLSCTKQGCNNDTDLSFGDSNKMFLFSSAESQVKGSIADQIIFVEPIQRADGTQQISFVMDRLYGNGTPTVLNNHIETIAKKARALKRAFPTVKISITVSSEAIATGSSGVESVMQYCSAHSLQAVEETTVVNIVPSALSDHYIEFGSAIDCRTAGPRTTRGIVISV